MLNILLRNPNHRLVLLYVSEIVIFSLIILDRFQNPGSWGVITYVLWLLMFAGLALILYCLQQKKRGIFSLGIIEGGAAPLAPTAYQHDRAKKVNRYLAIWLLSAELVALMIIFSFMPSSRSFPTLLLYVLFLVLGILGLIWSEWKYSFEVRMIDPFGDSAWGIPLFFGPLYLTAFLSGIYLFFAGMGLSAFITPWILSICPGIQTIFAIPYSSGIVFALFLTPVTVYLIKRRWE